MNSSASAGAATLYVGDSGAPTTGGSPTGHVLQTGGDLAEILDKIGHLVRERFKIWGQVKALTGEGSDFDTAVPLSFPPAPFRIFTSGVPRVRPDAKRRQQIAAGVSRQIVVDKAHRAANRRQQTARGLLSPLRG